MPITYVVHSFDPHKTLKQDVVEQAFRLAGAKTSVFTSIQTPGDATVTLGKGGVDVVALTDHSEFSLNLVKSTGKKVMTYNLGDRYCTSCLRKASVFLRVESWLQFTHHTHYKK